MKIAISATGSTLDSQVDPRFGRCASFVLHDTETQLSDAIANSHAGAMQGAGISAAQSLVDHGIVAVITSNVGPNAMQVLQSAGVKVYITPPTTVREAIRAFENDGLPEVHSPVQPGFGMGAGRGRGRGGGGRGRGMGF